VIFLLWSKDAEDMAGRGGQSRDVLITCIHSRAIYDYFDSHPLFDVVQFEQLIDLLASRTLTAAICITDSRFDDSLWIPSN